MNDRPMRPGDVLSADWINRAESLLRRLEKFAAGTGLSLQQSGAGISVQQAEVLRFQLVELLDTVQANDTSQNAERYRFDDTKLPGDAWQDSCQSFSDIADASQSVYLKGERHFVYTEPTSGQRILIPAPQWQFGCLTESLEQGGSATVEIYGSTEDGSCCGIVGKVDSADDLADMSVSINALDSGVLDPDGFPYEPATCVIVLQHRQTKQWFVLLVGGLCAMCSDVAATTSTTTSTTPPYGANGQGCVGSCSWTWDASSSSWINPVNSCSTTTSTSTTSTTSTTTEPASTTTTTASGSTTTTAPCCPSTTTSTSTSSTSTTSTSSTSTTSTSSTTTTTTSPCNCLYPTFCGQDDGECAITSCSTFVDEPSANSNCPPTTTTSTSTTSTSTTTAPGATTTTTTAPPTTTTWPCNSMPCGCTWVPSPYGWIQIGGNCYGGTCAPPSTDPSGLSPCAQATTNCTGPSQPSQPVESCTGSCVFTCYPTIGWLLTGYGPNGSCGGGVNGCTCIAPSFATCNCGDTATVNCAAPSGNYPTTTTPTGTTTTAPTTTTSTTTTGPCGTDRCKWTWADGSWTLATDCSDESCDCQEPPADGSGSCGTLYTPCSPSSTTTSTSTTSTSTSTSTTTTQPCVNNTCGWTFSYDPDNHDPSSNWIGNVSEEYGDEAIECNEFDSGSCNCDPPAFIYPSSAYDGTEATTNCYDPSTTTTAPGTTTTTSTTTTVPWLCTGHACQWGFNPLNNTFTLIYGSCSEAVDQPCSCPPPTNPPVFGFINCNNPYGPNGLCTDTLCTTTPPA